MDFKLEVFLLLLGRAQQASVTAINLANVAATNVLTTITLFSLVRRDVFNDSSLDNCLGDLSRASDKNLRVAKVVLGMVEQRLVALVDDLLRVVWPQNLVKLMLVPHAVVVLQGAQLELAVRQAVS